MQGREYRFFLNGTQVADPIGWNESAKKIRRDEKYKALFVEYVPDLTFHSDGFDFINNLITTNGFCTEVGVIVQERKSEYDLFTNYFIGTIRLMDVEVDEERKLIKCNVEDETLSALIRIREDVRVKLDAVKTMTGQTLIPAAQKTISVRDINAATYLSRYGYFVWDVFQMVLAYISDNRISFVSDYFSTQTTSRPTKVITFLNPAGDLTSGAPVVITYRNFFNQTNVISVTKAGTVLQTLTDIMEELNFNLTGLSDMRLYLDQNHRYPMSVTTNGTTSITMTFDLPFEIISVQGASVSAASIGAVDPSDGMDMLTLTTGSLLRNVTVNPTIPEITFEELFTEMNKHCNLGMEITWDTANNKAKVRVEKLSYFLEKQQALSMTNVKNLKYTVSNQFNADTIKVGQDNQNMVVNQFGHETYDKCTWGASSCSAKKLDLENKWISDFQVINSQKVNIDPKNDEKIFLLECTTSTQGTDAETIAYTNRICTDKIFSTFSTINVLNAHLTNYWKLKNHLQEIVVNPAREGKEIINTRDIFLIREYTFTHALTEAQRETVLSGKFQFVAFNQGTDIQDTKVGYVQEVELDNERSLCKFKLLTQ